MTQAGEVVLAHYQNTQAVIIGANGVLVSRSTDGKAHKIPPKTLLATLQDGRVEECGSAATSHPFKFDTTKALVVDQSNAVKPLADVIKAVGAEAVFAHNPAFPKGSPPNNLQQKKKMGFVPKNAEEFSKIVKAVEGSSKVSLMWVVTNREKKVGPKALGVVTMKQVPVRATGDENI